MTKEIVVSYFNENLEWLKHINDYKVTTYNKSGLSIDGTISLPNVGREMNSYFYHIINNYYNLSDWVFFTQGNPLDHVSNYIEILNGFPETLSKKEKSVDNCHFFSDKPVFECDLYGKPYHWGLNLKSVWDVIFKSSPLESFEFTPGCIFCVTKEQIMIRDVTFYEKCLEVTKNRVSSPWEFERLMPVIFNKDIT